MFAYCGNNPINCIDSTGDFSWILGAIGAGVSFVTTLVTGGDLGDACINAGISFFTSGSNAPRIVSSGISAVKTWIMGGSFSDGLKSGVITFATSYVSGTDILGNVASESERGLIDATFGLGANLIGTLVNNAIRSINNSNYQSSNKTNSIVPSARPSNLGYNWAGGGGGGGWSRGGEIRLNELY